MAIPADYKKRALAVNAALAVIALTAYVLTLSNSWGIWGIDYLVSTPLWARTMLVLMLVALAIPQVGIRAALISENILKIVTSISSVYLIIGIIILYATSAYLFRSFNHALGDGHNLLANIADTTVIRPTEPLEYYLHLLVFKVFFARLGAVRAYQLLSIVAGIGLLFTIRAFVKGKAAFLVALVAIATFGTTQFFFGYVEHYTFAFVFSVLFLLSGLRDLERQKASWVTYTAFLLAILSHLYSLMFFPVAIFLIWKTMGRKFALSLIPVMGAILVGLIAFEQVLIQTKIAEIILPLIPTEVNPYSIFSLEHVGDLISLAVLSFPLIVAIPFLPFGGSRGQRTMILFAFISALLFTITMDPSLGAARDWDLLSAAAAPILVFIVHSIDKLESDSKKLKFLLFLPLTVFGAFHTGGWIYHNSSMSAGYERIKHVVSSDIHYSAGYYDGYRNKSWSVIAEERYADRNESIRASLVRYEAAPLDPANTVHLAEKYFAVRDTASAVALGQKHWRDFMTDDQNVIPAIGSMMMQAKRLDLAEQIYEDFVSRGYMEFTVLHNLAYCKDHRGQSDSAMTIYKMAFDNFTAPISYEFEFYLKCVQTGRYESALRGLRKILPKINKSSRLESERLVQALEAKDIALVDSLAELITKRLPR
jgi:hypothetical protein